MAGHGGVVITPSNRRGIDAQTLRIGFLSSMAVHADSMRIFPNAGSFHLLLSYS
jgi:hypothetical protein